MIAIDQYGSTYRISGKHIRKELLGLHCAKNAQKLYIDDKDGNSHHVGYVIRNLHLQIYKLTNAFERS